MGRSSENDDRYFDQARKVIDFHQARIAFEKALKHYRRYRQELEDEVKTLLILEGLKSADATSDLLDRLGKITALVISVANTFNDMAKWSITTLPEAACIKPT